MAQMETRKEMPVSTDGLCPECGDAEAVKVGRNQARCCRCQARFIDTSESSKSRPGSSSAPSARGGPKMSAREKFHADMRKVSGSKHPQTYKDRYDEVENVYQDRQTERDRLLAHWKNERELVLERERIENERLAAQVNAESEREATREATERARINAETEREVARLRAENERYQARDQAECERLKLWMRYAGGKGDHENSDTV